MLTQCQDNAITIIAVSYTHLMQRRKFGVHRVDAALDAHHNRQAKGITALGDFLVTAPLKGVLRLWRRQGDPFFIELIQSRRKRGGISK